MLALVSSSTVMAYSLYTFSAPNLPANHTMMLTVPFVLYGLFRYLYLIHVKGETDPPDVVVLKDRALQIDVRCLGWSCLVIFYVLPRLVAPLSSRRCADRDPGAHRAGRRVAAPGCNRERLFLLCMKKPLFSMNRGFNSSHAGRTAYASAAGVALGLRLRDACLGLRLRLSRQPSRLEPPLGGSAGASTLTSASGFRRPAA